MDISVYSLWSIQCTFACSSNYIKPQDFPNMVAFLGFGATCQASALRHFQISPEMFTRKKKKRRAAKYFLDAYSIYSTCGDANSALMAAGGRGGSSIHQPKFPHLWWRGLISDPEWNIEQPWILHNEGSLRCEALSVACGWKKKRGCHERAANERFHTWYQNYIHVIYKQIGLPSSLPVTIWRGSFDDFFSPTPFL